MGAIYRFDPLTKLVISSLPLFYSCDLRLICFHQFGDLLLSHARINKGHYHLLWSFYVHATHNNTLMYNGQYTCAFVLGVFLIKNTDMNKPNFSTTITNLFLLDPTLRKENGTLNVTKAAKKAGIQQPTLKRIIDGAVSHMRPEQEEKLMTYFGLSSRDELYNKKESDNVSPGPDTKGLVPLISGIQAGEWAEAIDLFEPYDAEALYPCPAPHGPHTYCLRVEGDSMTSPVGRSYPEGALIYVDPDQNCCAPGDRVVAKRSGENGVTFKQLAKDGDRLYLKPLNPHHPPIFDEFKIIGKVIGMWMEE